MGPRPHKGWGDILCQFSPALPCRFPSQLAPVSSPMISTCYAAMSSVNRAEGTSSPSKMAMIGFATSSHCLICSGLSRRRAKSGTPGIHGLQGDELRLIRQLIRENGERSRFRKAPLSIDGAQKLIERLGEAARLPSRSMPTCYGTRPGMPLRGAALIPGPSSLHGAPIDRQYGHLHGRRRQAPPAYLGSLNLPALREIRSSPLRRGGKGCR
jgi:hypothetical protein